MKTSIPNRWNLIKELSETMKGRYPKAMLGTICMVAFALTVTTSAFAHHRSGHNPPGQSKKYNKSYKVKRGGPPAWAPAWGYRAKYGYHSGGRYYEVTPQDLVRIPDSGSGIGSCNREILGALLGGAAGAAAGTQIGSGSGKTAATIAGTIIGALVGGNIGRSMDQVDQSCIGQALEQAPTGQSVGWRNPDQGGQYQVTPTRTYETSAGRYCREYQIKIIIGGKVENAYGTACRQPDGTWKKV